MIDVTNERADRVARNVAERCHGDRKPGAAPQRYAMIYQAARLGALEMAKCTPDPEARALLEALSPLVEQTKQDMVDDANAAIESGERPDLFDYCVEVSIELAEQMLAYLARQGPDQ